MNQDFEPKSHDEEVPQGTEAQSTPPIPPAPSAPPPYYQPNYNNPNTYYQNQQNTGYYTNSYPNYQQPNGYPYPVYQPIPKKPMSTGLKVFIFIISFVAVGTIFGFIIFGIYNAVSNANSMVNYLDSYYDEYFDNTPYEYFYDDDDDGSYGNGQPDSSKDEYSEILPPDYEQSIPDNELAQPDFDFDFMTGGILLNSKPKTAELTAEEVYAKIESSTITVSAQVPIANGIYSDSVGTGIILTEDGFMLTNSHVVGNTTSSIVTIITSDGTEHPALVVGCDKSTDLAVLKVDSTGFIPAEFGDSTELNIGEWVIAVGTPGGEKFSGSLTRGVISGLDRSVGNYSSNGMTYIQTDAAINPGNSGGPLVNMYGQVVGINSSKIVSQYYEGMGFTIPISQAKTIVDQLLSKGYVSGRTRLGIVGQNNLYSEPRGVIIVTINEESSFSGTGAAEGDIITAVDGTAVTTLTALADALLNYKPGDTAEITLYRGLTGEEITVTITLLEDAGYTQKR